MSDNMDPPPELDRRKIVASFTMLNCYKNICKHQAYRRYIRRDIKFVETPQIKWGNEVHTAMEHRIGGGKPLPPNMPYEPFAKVFDGRNAKAEEKMGVTIDGKPTGFFDDNVFLRGKLDVNLVNGATGYVGDFKTGKVREETYELEVQAVLLHAKHPKLTKIIGQYFWLAEAKLGVLHDLSATAQTWDGIHKTMAELHMDKSRGTFEKKPGPLCSWCPVTDCEFWKERK